VATHYIRNGVYLRKDYSKIDKVVPMPNLIEVQKESFVRFLQDGVSEKDKEPVGLQAAFRSPNTRLKSAVRRA